MKRIIQSSLLLLFCLSATQASALWFLGGSSQSAKAEPQQDTRPVHLYTLSGTITERPVGAGLFEPTEVQSWAHLVQSLQEDIHNPQIKRILLDARTASLNWAQAEELAALLHEARTQKRDPIVYLERVNLPLLVAAAPARLIIAPEAQLIIPGLQAEIFYLRDLLASYGIRGDFEAVGKYKSAVEPFTRNAPSEAALENLESMVDALYRQCIRQIAQPRRLREQAVEAAIDKGLIEAEEAKKLGLIDDIQSYSDLLAQTVTQLGEIATVWPEEDTSPEDLSFFDLLNLLKSDRAPENTDPKIVVLVAEGGIIDGEAPNSPFPGSPVIASHNFIEELDAIASDPSVRALVLRISSPGGSALASDIIWQKLRSLRAQMPVIASLSDVAASGGYYIASAADRIHANPTTLTGSIGVFAGKIIYGELLDKVGISTIRISRGQNAGIFSGLTPFSPSERQVLRASMENTYQTFVNRVATGRQMSYDAVHRVAQGRVWTGEQAKDIGLVDSLGGLSSALDEAIQRAKDIDKDAPLIVIRPAPKGLFDTLSSSRSGAISLRHPALSSPLPPPLSELSTRAEALIALLQGSELGLALWPIDFHWRL